MRTLTWVRIIILQYHYNVCIIGFLNENKYIDILLYTNDFLNFNNIIYNEYKYCTMYATFLYHLKNF